MTAEEARDRARAMWSAGYSLRYIARSLGVGESRVLRAIERVSAGRYDG